MKNSKNYVMISPATLTQNGLLAVLLQRQRRKVIESAQRRTRREQVRAVFWNCWRALHGASALATAAAFILTTHFSCRRGQQRQAPPL